ncbi:hypothetical protein WMY93_011364 [Mugilogobius chulae]|uniref:Uncharacterized protein n=1 Tax=Mugilogobius chulae TaxID=88201 RepID=A0AAW0P8F7_9GOBI
MLSADPEENLWLLGQLARDPIDNTKSGCLGVVVDCVRLRLAREDVNRERERLENERMTEYNNLVKNRVAQATLIKQLGLQGAKAKMRQLQLSQTAAKNTDYCAVMYRFARLIDRVFEYFRVRGMKMEPFQLDLFRGVVLGVSGKQFGDALFRYKHTLLEKLGLTPLGSDNYDHVNPALSHFYHVEKRYSQYAKPYTLCLAQGSVAKV